MHTSEIWRTGAALAMFMVSPYRRWWCRYDLASALNSSVDAGCRQIFYQNFETRSPHERCGHTVLSMGPIIQGAEVVFDPAKFIYRQLVELMWRPGDRVG